MKTLNIEVHVSDKEEKRLGRVGAAPKFVRLTETAFVDLQDVSGPGNPGRL